MSDYTNGIDADYWDDDPDAERLTHKTLALAVEVFVEHEAGSASDKTALLECLRVLSPRSFFAWKRAMVTPVLVESVARDLAERAVSYGLEELIDPEGRPCDELLEVRLRLAFGNVLRDELQHGTWKPWHCEPVGQVTLTAVQMEALMREHRPDWF